VPERYFRSPSSGLLVHHRSWLPAGPPRGVVYLLHGLFEHVERYTHVGAFLAAAGFAVHGLDHQGHGQSEGDGGYFSSFDSMVADALHLAQVALPAPEGVPRFLFGALESAAPPRRAHAHTPPPQPHTPNTRTRARAMAPPPLQATQWAGSSR
jgi:hypothetical protein